MTLCIQYLSSFTSLFTHRLHRIARLPQTIVRFCPQAYIVGKQNDVNLYPLGAAIHRSTSSAPNNLNLFIAPSLIKYGMIPTGTTLKVSDIFGVNRICACSADCQNTLVVR